MGMGGQRGGAGDPRPLDGRAVAGGGSRITLEHGGWPETTGDDTTRDDHLGYWEAYLEDLAALLAAELVAPPRRVPTIERLDFGT